MKRRKIFKMTAMACAMIGATTILFSMAAEAAVKAKSGQVERISTSYRVTDSRTESLTETEKRGKTRKRSIIT